MEVSRARLGCTQMADAERNIFSLQRSRTSALTVVRCGALPPRELPSPLERGGAECADPNSTGTPVYRVPRGARRAISRFHSLYGILYRSILRPRLRGTDGYASNRESCFAQLRPNAGRMSENGGHHANQRRKLALERCCQLFVRYLPLHM